MGACLWAGPDERSWLCDLTSGSVSNSSGDTFGPSDMALRVGAAAPVAVDLGTDSNASIRIVNLRRGVLNHQMQCLAD